MSTSAFAKGDTVRLKSGGPLMTVVGVGGGDQAGTSGVVKCQWFKRDRPQEGVFEAVVLMRSDDKPGVSVVRFR